MDSYDPFWVREDRWYEDCTDLCGNCFHRPLKTTTLDGHAFFCRACENQSEADPNIALAVAKWNIKQRKIRGIIK